jgi:lipopolysaccharide biosynthesis regulator YciM
MESLDRKDNRLISSLIDLKLESARHGTIIEEVPFLSSRENVNQERLVWSEAFTTIRSMKISSKLLKKRASTTKHSSSKVSELILRSLLSSRIKKSKNYCSKSSDFAKSTKANT